MGNERTTDNKDLRSLPVTLIPGVGPKRRDGLARLGINNLYDLLYYTPTRYEDLQAESGGADGQSLISAKVTVCGTVQVRAHGHHSLLTVPVKLQERVVEMRFFNQPFLRHQLNVGRSLRVRGKWDVAMSHLTVSTHEFIRPESAHEQFTIIPIYRLTEDFPASILRKIIFDALRLYGDQFCEELPVTLRERFRLLPIGNAVFSMHQPRGSEDVRQAKRRLIFEEFLKFQLRIQGFRRARQEIGLPTLEGDMFAAAYTSFVNTLPFSLTSDQRRAIAEIAQDVIGFTPMHRVLQGDVGSGKTAVVFAMCAALARCGWQSAIMAPTTILALQHFHDAERLLKPYGVRVGYLAGSVSASKRTAMLEQLAKGEIDVVIGTHVLSSPEVTFAKIRLVAIDEQHRFGVMTRRFLREKAKGIDVLQLSATPIPRSLSLTLYGDVAISTIRELPPGRQPIVTTVFSRSQEQDALRILRRELGKGHQAYIIAPFISPISESNTGSVPHFTNGSSVEELYTRMSDELAPYSVMVMHGAMSEDSRSDTMARFVAGAVSVLIATTIVEVGVSVDNATVMVVFDAERFGLATLHQLRGRVRRSIYPATCLLIGEPTTDHAQKRLEAMRESQDGFWLSEQDLILRGPGEAFGDRQSGVPEFIMGDVIQDIRIMEVARDVVQEMFLSEDFWLLPAYRFLRQYIGREDVLVDS